MPVTAERVRDWMEPQPVVEVLIMSRITARAALFAPLLAIALLATACSSSQPTETKEPTPEAKVGPPKPWDTMSFGEKRGYMAKIVTPTMKRVFQAYDAEAFADFSCETCHGEDAKAREFKMPNADLPKLYPFGSPEHEAMVAKYKGDPHSALEFMATQVVPTMTELLGAQPYDEATHTGFSCMNCHTLGG